MSKSDKEYLSDIHKNKANKMNVGFFFPLPQMENKQIKIQVCLGDEGQKLHGET